MQCYTALQAQIIAYADNVKVYTTFEPSPWTNDLQHDLAAVAARARSLQLYTAVAKHLYYMLVPKPASCNMTSLCIPGHHIKHSEHMAFGLHSMLFMKTLSGLKQ